MAAAWSGGHYATVRGTSFAAPIVTGLLAGLMTDTNMSPDAATDRLARNAVHDHIYGRGLVGADLRIPPAAVNAMAVTAH